jgi:ubiquinone/menaquinone biosynthesis C-methylase UbiE
MPGFISKQFRRPTGFLGKIISRVMVKGNSPVYDKIIRELDIKPYDRILEIGYGPGIGVHRIASAHDCLVTGIDFSELMFREASRRNKKNIASEKVELILGNYLASDMGSNRFDKVFCTNVIYFWDKPEVPFAKVLLNLKAGGMFYIFMVHPGYLEKNKFAKHSIFNKYSVDQVMGFLILAGFQDVGYTFDKGYVIHGRKQTV